MYSKIRITGNIKVVTGLHIGGGGQTSMIGAVDSPIVKDPFTKLPIIPGSSLKGKLRYLLARKKGFIPNQKTHNQDDKEVLRLFGASKEEMENENQNGVKVIQARLQFLDAFYSEQSLKEIDELDRLHIEVKYENSIDRLTGIANPRQIERVVRGSKFDFEIIYNVDKVDEVIEDFENLSEAIDLLEYDYLGGGGTRGNGRVKFENIDITTVIGDYDSSKLKQILSKA